MPNCGRPDDLSLWDLVSGAVSSLSGGTCIKWGHASKERHLVSEVSRSGMWQYDPLAQLRPKKQLVNFLGMIPVPIILPIAGLVIIVAQIIYGDTPQKLWFILRHYGLIPATFSDEERAPRRNRSQTLPLPKGQLHVLIFACTIELFNLLVTFFH